VLRGVKRKWCIGVFGVPMKAQKIVESQRYRLKEQNTMPPLGSIVNENQSRASCLIKPRFALASFNCIARVALESKFPFKAVPYDPRSISKYLR
jgi:hypothetical protein